MSGFCINKIIFQNFYLKNTCRNTLFEGNGYTYQSKYEYAEVDVENPLYKDLIDNLSFKKKFGDQYDFPYTLYMY